MPRPQGSVFIATSLDGYIARADGRIDWLEAANAAVPPGEDCGYAAFIATIDALVMGRNTFDLARTFPAWPYGDLPVYVWTRRPGPPDAPATVRFTSDAPADLVMALGAAGHRRLYVDGGLTIQAFLRAGLIDDLTVTTIPVLLGAGKPLFGALDGDVALRHVATHAYPFGFVQTRYEVVR